MRYCANGSEFADLAFSNVMANFRQSSLVVKAIDTGYTTKLRQGLLIKHIQKLAKSSHFIGSKCSTLVVGVGNN